MIKYLLLIILFIWGCQHSPSFKFALLSDTHIQENSPANDELTQVIDDVNNNPDIEFVLVSGDITEINTGKNLMHAKEILDGLNKPYYIIPGNHDTKWSGSGGANFRALWGDDKFVFDFNEHRFIGFHQGPVLRMDDGHISLETLSWLEQILSETAKEKSIILVMHYPLNSSIDNWYECVNIIKDHNVKAILHGHGHRNRLHYYNGIPGIMGRSTLKAGSDSPGYTILEIRNDSLFAFEKKTNSIKPEIWQSVSLQRQTSNAEIADSLLPDYSINKEFMNVKLKWLYNSGYMMTASPTYDQDKIYVGNVAGSMICLDRQDGREIWKFNANEAIYGTAAVKDSFLVFTSADSNIYCINNNSGQKIWSYKTGNAIVSVAVIDNENVYVGASDSIFRCLNLSTGKQIWEFKDVSGYVETKPLIYQGKVFFGAWDGYLYAIDKISGNLVWKWQGPQSHSLYSPAACWPVAASGKIFVAAPDRYISAINAETGKTVWRNNHWKFRETIGVSENGKYIYARSMTDSVVAFYASGAKAKIKWVEDFGYGYDIAPSMPVEKDGTLFWGTKNGLIIAADAFSGQLKWKYKFQNYLINTVTPLSENSIFFSNIDGFVGILKNN